MRKDYAPESIALSPVRAGGVIPPASRWEETLLGRRCSVDLECQTGDFPGGRIAVKDSAVHGMVDKGNHTHESLFGLFGLSCGNGLFNLAGKGAHGGNGLAVALPALGISSNIFFCRLVIRQRSSLLTEKGKDPKNFSWDLP